MSPKTQDSNRSPIARAWNFIWSATRRYFVAGLVAFAPIGITFWAIAWIIERLDNLLLPQVVAWFFPAMEHPIELPPLVGALFTFFVILLSGVIVRHFFGQELVRGWERLLSRVPVARSIYGGIKQLFESFVAGDRKTGFNTVVLVEYPRKGIWALAFTTGDTSGPVDDAFPGQDMVNCFLPTTPNPTSGFYLVIPRDEVREVSLTVEEAFKVIMSAGLVTPGASGLRPAAHSPNAAEPTSAAGD
ncbi:MAG: putative membrane protein [Myxococcota bacterium]